MIDASKNIDHSGDLTLSVVVAAHNEAEMLDKSLGSIAKLADEIIVVDGESSDGTVAIAEKYHAKIIKTTNKLNFHINKKMGLEAAKSDLVFQLDADEEVDAELLDFIGRLKHDSDLVSSAPAFQDFQSKAWSLKRKNWFLGKFLTKGGQYPDCVTRLYIRGYATLPAKDVHEQLEVEGEVAFAQGHLIHYSNPTFADYLRKFNHYTTFKAVQLLDSGVQISLLSLIKYLCWLPSQTFFLIFLRHRGYVDGMSGFVFAVMSGAHHWVAFLKLWELYERKKQGLEIDKKNYK